ncbi:ELWxxDGT repeat protein [Spirosoma arcticum]
MKHNYNRATLRIAAALIWSLLLTGALAQRPVALTTGGAVGNEPKEFAAYGGGLYFSAKSAADGLEVYSTDGTPAGTSLLTNINTAAGAGSDPNEFTVYHDRLFFTAATGATGRELWVTNGTAGGTMLVKDIFPGSSSSDPKQLTVSNGRLYFVAQNGPQRELWTSDGTTGGTRRLSDELGVPTGGSNPTELTASGNKLFYRIDFTNLLWITDGTAGGTRLVKGGPLNPLNPDGPRLFISLGNFIPLNETGKIIFRANSPGTEDEPWVSDGTPEGTFSLDISPGGNASFPNIISGSNTAYNGRVYFVASQAIPSSPVRTGLFATDGTVGGTQFIKNVPIANEFEVLDGKLYFFSGGGLWVTDGSEAGTLSVKVLPGSPTKLTAVGDSLYFTVSGSFDSRDLWASDGTAAGTIRLADYNLNAESILRSVNDLTGFNDKLYFTARPGLSERDLWRLDNVNLPPVAPVIPNVTGTVGVGFNQVIPSFTDPEVLPLSYTVVGLPANLSFSGGSGGIVAGVPVVAGVFPVTVSARDRSGNVTSVTYTITINPIGGGMAFALLAPTYNCASGFISFNISGSNGSPVVFNAPGIQRGSLTAFNGTVEDGLRNDPKPIVIQATQSGTTVSVTFDLPGACGGGPSPGGALTLLAPTYNCATGAITLNTSGGDGSPIVFSAPGVQRSSLTAATGTVEDGLRNDPKPILLQATQSGITVSYTFNLPAACGSARRGVGESVAELSVRVFANPSVNGIAEVEISGADGQPVQWTVSDTRGRAISDERIERAAPLEKRTIRLNAEPGLYFLRVNTTTQTKTIKILRQ